MDIYRYPIMIVAFFILAAVTIIVLRRRGEKKQNKLEAQQQPTEEVLNVKKINSYLTDHEISHDMFAQRYKTFRREYDILVRNNEPVGPLLVERLRSLDDLIALQMQDDDKFPLRLSRDDDWIIALRHEDWKVYQEGIAEMLAWKPVG